MPNDEHERSRIGPRWHSFGRFAASILRARPASRRHLGKRKPALSGGSPGGRYWARTSDPQLVETAQAFASVRVCSLIPANGRFPFGAVRGERTRTDTRCEHCGHESAPEAPLGQLRGCLLAALVGQAGIDPKRDLCVRVSGKCGDLGSGQTAIESDRDERMAKVVQPDRLGPIPIQADLVACPVQRTEQVAPRLRLAAQRRENESLWAHPLQVAFRLPDPVRDGMATGDLTVMAMGNESKFNVNKDDGKEMTDLIRNRTSAAQQAAAVPSSDQGDIPDQLRKLAELRDAGIISPEEFESKKDDLLSRM
jgi:Short C-terminal domain